MAGAVVFYPLLAAAGWLWLWLRDRVDAIGPAAHGLHGAPVAFAVGAGLGLGLSGAYELLFRYSGAFARLHSHLRRLIGTPSEGQAIALGLFSAVGEEFFFRMAMHDALGLWPTALLFGLLHVGPKGIRLNGCLALLLGIAFGLMVEFGLGLLSVTLAHALINYFSLRRLEKA